MTDQRLAYKYLYYNVHVSVEAQVPSLVTLCMTHGMAKHILLLKHS